MPVYLSCISTYVHKMCLSGTNNLHSSWLECLVVASKASLGLLQCGARQAIYAPNGGPRGACRPRSSCGRGFGVMLYKCKSYHVRPIIKSVEGSNKQ